ncbi:hypothetical protein [Nonomuraea aridisoli]|uniref:Uncharacterized protein n=1 Tax=Nonomuraea aridisoli TaxID=2070368 RepID=A0A2W2DUJ5_9ACTN|nr:hypothetical protein [Nonomuraea aridisoli]PZG15586.1 hypothetical protein C1J01_23645 [Nonomuraea aridisoli]
MLFDALGIGLDVVEGLARGEGVGNGVDATRRPTTLGVGVGVEAALDRDPALSVPQPIDQMPMLAQMRSPAMRAGRGRL